MVERVPKITKADVLRAQAVSKQEDADEMSQLSLQNIDNVKASQQLPTPPETIANPTLPSIPILIDPPTPEQVTHSIPSLLDKAQYLALEALIQKLDNIADLSPTTLLSIVTALQDLKITTEWTLKLKDAIAKKARLIVPPGSRSSLQAKKLGSLAGQVQDSSKADNREGASKLNSLLLPQDE